MFHLFLRLSPFLVFTTLTVPAFAQGLENAGDSSGSPLVIAELAYISFVLIGGTIVSCCKRDKSAPLRGLNLPQGSVRSMLALLVVGTFVIFLILGHEVDKFDSVVTAFGTLTGAVIGFYFAHRGAEKQREFENPDAEKVNKKVQSANTGSNG